MTGACGRQSESIIPLLVPDESIEPGVESWHPGVCGECAAACGVLARVMVAERVIDDGGEPVRQQVAAVKKLEGNPEDPVSGGRLCARGHAGLQSLYNPDRAKGPMRRAGPRGEGRFEPITWESAMQQAADMLRAAIDEDPQRIMFFARPRADLRSANIARFLRELGAPPAAATGMGCFEAEIEGARRAYGWQGIPSYDIGESTLVLSIGADFLGGWVSPVLYARQYGHMRRGRAGLRGRLIQAESRFSLTAWNADRWLPVSPGGELALALGIGRALLDGGAGASALAAPRAVRSAFSTIDVDQAAAVAGIGANEIREVASELAESPAPVVLAGASIVRENSAEAVTAACALNILLGRVGVQGGVMPPSSPLAALDRARPSSARWPERSSEPRLVMVDGANPAYSSPSSIDALRQAESVISLSPFIDETTAFADLILPDHDALERDAMAVPAVSPVPSVTLGAAFVAPLHDTRPADRVLAELAQMVARPFEPLDSAGGLALLHEALDGRLGGKSAEDFAKTALQKGAWQGPEPASVPAGASEIEGFSLREEEASGVFQAYESPQFGDGGGANRPWLQELPDPTSSAMWGLPVELDPATASSLAVRNGDMVRVSSDHGSLEAPVYVNPAAIPGVISMAIGQGHSTYGRYASGRGSNPLLLLGEMRDSRTGAIAMGPTRVRLEKVGTRGRLVQFSRADRDVPSQRNEGRI